MFLAFFVAGIKKTSDTVLLTLLISLSSLAIACWVFFGFRPMYSELNVLALHNNNLIQRIGSLQKRTNHSGAVEQRLSKMHQVFVRLSPTIHRSTHQGICQLLEHIHLSGLRLVSWKPGAQTEYLYGVEQRVECELQGSFEDLYKLIVALGTFCYRTCTIVRQSHELLVKTCVSVYAKKEQL